MNGLVSRKPRKHPEYCYHGACEDCPMGKVGKRGRCGKTKQIELGEDDIPGHRD
jgi:hypothetical protein